MIEHMVLLKFGPQTAAAQKEEAIRRLRALHDLDGIEDLRCNHNTSERSQGFEVGLTVRFADRPSLDAYIVHPRHRAVVGYLQEIGVENTLVVDFAAD